MNIRIAGPIVQDSIVDGPGIRHTIFTQGCHWNCPGCHNPESHSLSGGKIVKVDDLYMELKEILRPSIHRGITFSGGDPFLWPSELSCLSEKIKTLGNYDIMVYTGYSMEELKPLKKWIKFLELIDLLVTDRFILDQKDLSTPFRGSRNQRIWKKIIRNNGMMFFEQISERDILGGKL